MSHFQHPLSREPNPPWLRCSEKATHSEAVVFKDGRSFILYVCEHHWSGGDFTAGPPPSFNGSSAT